MTSPGLPYVCKDLDAQLIADVFAILIGLLLLVDYNFVYSTSIASCGIEYKCVQDF